MLEEKISGVERELKAVGAEFQQTKEELQALEPRTNQLRQTYEQVRLYRSVDLLVRSVH